MELIYVMDPLCSWCYGFSENLEKLMKKYGDTFKFSILTGGLFINENVRFANRGMTRYFLAGNDKIHKRTNAFFGGDFEKLLLSNEKLRLDSEPPSRAIATVKILYPDRVFEYSKKIQTKFFADGEDLNNSNLYSEIAHELNLDTHEIMHLLKANESKIYVDEMFGRVKELGLSSYPALLFNDGDLTFPIVEGYEDYNEVDLTIQELF